VVVALFCRVAAAACDIPAPQDGQTTTCTSDPPNPSTTPITPAGDTGITVQLLPGAALQTTGGVAVSIPTHSTVVNNGLVSSDGPAANGVHSLGTGNRIENNGTMATSGPGARTVFTEGSDTTMVINRGRIAATGSGGVTVFSGDGLALTNTAGARIASSLGNAVFANEGGSIDNAGTIEAGASAIIVNNAGITITNSGTITSTGGNAIGTSGPGNVVIVNTGSIGGSFRALDLDSGNDLLRMEGGTIQGPILTRDGDDTVVLSAGQIDTLDLGAGRNTLAVSGGTVGGDVTNVQDVTLSGGAVHNITYGSGDGTLRISGGNVIGTIVFGAGTNTATLAGLDESALPGLVSIQAGAGDSTLTLDQTRLTGLARFVGFGHVNLLDGSVMTLDPELVLGPAAPVGPAALLLQPRATADPPNSLFIDATSTLQVDGSGVGTVRAAAPGGLAAVTNAGTIDLTRGSQPAAGRLTIVGSYTGSGGQLLARAVLAGDGAPSDRLIVAQGVASGSTVIVVANAGGLGALTTGDGIPVVVLTNGGTSTLDAFSLSGGSIAVGAFRYVLFRGGVSAGTGDSWFLRSSLPPPPPPPPPPDATPAPAPAPAPSPGAAPSPAPSPAPAPPPTPEPAAGSPPLPAPAAGDVAVVPLFRPEVPVYAAVQMVARSLAFDQIGTFHDRQGTQALLTETGALAASWSRVWGGRKHLRQDGDTSPAFSGATGGMQLGQDLYAANSVGGHRDHAGLMFGFARASGDVSGLALGFPDFAAGTLAVNAYTVGAYWTHLAPGGAYTDVVLQGGTLTVDPRSVAGLGATTHGKSFAASFEAGLPLAVGPALSVEPQVQAVWARTWVNDLQDAVSAVAFDNGSANAVRAGVRVQYAMQSGSMLWQPWLRTDVTWSGGGTDQVVFAGTTAVATSVSATTGRVELGASGRSARHGSVYGSAAYLTSLDGTARHAWYGSLGVRWAW